MLADASRRARLRADSESLLRRVVRAIERVAKRDGTTERRPPVRSYVRVHVLDGYEKADLERVKEICRS